MGTILITGSAAALRKLGSVLESLKLQTELETAAREIERAVKEALSEPPGTGDHSAPWLQTGALRGSITHQATQAEAVVGSTEEVAVFQELGTRSIPPRPFLAPTAASVAPDVVSQISRHLAVGLGDRT